MPKVSGLHFREAYQRAVSVELDGVTARVISLPDLLVNKQASARAKDIADLEKLSKMTSHDA